MLSPRTEYTIEEKYTNLSIRDVIEEYLKTRSG